MSHHATNWAIQQRGLKPALKVVLWHLADRHHRDNGCFPSQDTLADDCEVPRSTLNVYLDELEKRGLIARERRRRAGSQRQERTRYYFPFEPEFQRFTASEPSPETGHGSRGGAESRNQAEPSPENGESRVQNLDSNLVREPVIEPGREREGASADEGQEGNHSSAAEMAASAPRPPKPEEQASLVRRVKAMELGSRPAYSGTPWPGAQGSSTSWAASQFAKLDDQERADAEKLRDTYLATCERNRVKPVAIGVYFRDRKWEGLTVAAKDAAPRLKGGRIAVAVLGPVYAAAYMAEVLKAPRPVHLPDDVRQTTLKTAEAFQRLNPQKARDYLAAKGISLDADGKAVFPSTFERDEERRLRMSDGFPGAKRLQDASRDRQAVTVDDRFEALKEAMEFVPSASQAMERWQQWFAANHLPFPPVAPRGGYFPAGGPDAMDDFRAALLATATDEGQHDAA